MLFKLNTNYLLKKLHHITIIKHYKFLFCDLDSFQNSHVRAYFESEQVRLLQKRCVQRQDQETLPPSTSFG